MAALPASFGQLQSLQMLDMGECTGVARLPDSFGQLASLEVLRMHGCMGFTALPKSVSGAHGAAVVAPGEVHRPDRTSRQH